MVHLFVNWLEKCNVKDTKPISFPRKKMVYKKAWVWKCLPISKLFLNDYFEVHISCIDKSIFLLIEMVFSFF